MKKLLCIILLSLALCLPTFGQFNDSEPMFGQMLNLGHWSTDGLVFYWRGIEAGEVVDESFYGNDGTITGATWVGDGLSFDATSEKIVISSPIGFNVNTGAMILGFTPNWNHDDGVAHRLYDTDVNLALTILKHANGTTFIYLNGALKGSLVFPWLAGVKYQVVFTWPDAKLYANGVQILDATDSIAGSFSTMTLFNVQAASLNFDGVGHYVSTYNRALSESEISALYINPDLPMAQDPIWMMFSPEVGVGRVNIFDSRIFGGSGVFR